jgi:allene oxide cyclase
MEQRAGGIIMVKQRNRALLAAGGFLTLLAFGNAAAAAAEMKTLKFVERAATDVVTDLGDKGDTVGDVLTFSNLVFDEKNEKQVGTDQGWCIRVSVGKSWECFWTMILSDGQITVEGPFNDGADSVLAVTGGTGAYASVSGEMSLHGRNAEGTEYDFGYTLVW